VRAGSRDRPYTRLDTAYSTEATIFGQQQTATTCRPLHPSNGIGKWFEAASANVTF